MFNMYVLISINTYVLIQQLSSWAVGRVKSEKRRRQPTPRSSQSTQAPAVRFQTPGAVGTAHRKRNPDD